MLKMIFGHLGISVFDYYEMTPREIDLTVEGYVSKYKNDIEMAAIATKIAYINAMNKKNYKVFPKEKKEGIIDIDEKKRQLDELKNKFS